MKTAHTYLVGNNPSDELVSDLADDFGVLPTILCPTSTEACHELIWHLIELVESGVVVNLALLEGLEEPINLAEAPHLIRLLGAFLEHSGSTRLLVLTPTR